MTKGNSCFGYKVHKFKEDLPIEDVMTQKQAWRLIAKACGASTQETRIALILVYSHMNEKNRITEQLLKQASELKKLMNTK